MTCSFNPRSASEALGIANPSSGLQEGWNIPNRLPEVPAHAAERERHAGATSQRTVDWPPNSKARVH
jgi:hypothetical protein